VIVCGIDLGARKVAISTFVDGELTLAQSLEVPKTTRARELRTLGEWTFGYTKIANYAFVEEPLIGRGVRSSLQIAQTAGAVMSAMGGLLAIDSRFVDNKTWKKQVVGNGNASKEMIEEWLKRTHPAYAALCGSNQDRIDAACIGIYGVQVLERRDTMAGL